MAMVNCGGSKWMVITSWSLSQTCTWRSFMLLTMRSLTRDTLWWALISQNAFGGLICCLTLPGLWRPASSANCDKPSRSSYHLQFPSLHIYLQKCIWTPCISPSLEASSTLYRVAALSLTGWSSNVFKQRQHTHWANGSTKASFAGGEHSLWSSPTMGLHLSKLVNNCQRCTTLITSTFQDTTSRWMVLSSDLTSMYNKPCSKWLWVTSHAGVSLHTPSFGLTA